jgi:hypothetical protein
LVVMLKHDVVQISLMRIRNLKDVYKL